MENGPPDIVKSFESRILRKKRWRRGGGGVLHKGVRAF
jgi:hypothetical protein